MKNQKMIIFAAPSGAGKTTIVRHLLEKYEVLKFSISATTRSRRSHEIDGEDYFFLSKEEFNENISNHAFAEYEEVYPGLFYGTLKSEIRRIWALNKAVIFDIDVKGALNLKSQYGESCLTVFIKVPTLEMLLERLRKRDTESPEEIEIRSSRIKKEMEYENRFDKTIVNLNLDDVLLEAENIVEEFLEINKD